MFSEKNEWRLSAVNSQNGRGTPHPSCGDDKEHERTSVDAPRRYRAGSISRPRCAPQMLQCKSSSSSLAQEHERTSVNAPRRYRAGSISRPRCAPQMLQCKSSSSSLAQLREKLTALSPIVFNKVTAKIAVTPELSAVKEQDEYERFRRRPIPRCGVVTYTKNYNSETRQREPAKTATIDLVAALGTSDQLVLEEAREQLYKKKPRVELSDCLAEQPKKHTQHKDTPLAQLREKLTALSPIVFNTVTAKIAVTPELSAVKEQDEYERFRRRPIPRCGVVTYTTNYNSETRQREPAKTATIDLVAALGTSDQLVLEEAREQLYKKKPRVELSDCFTEQPKKHTQHKDTSLAQLREKLTVPSSTVFNDVAATLELSAVKEQDRKHYNTEARQRGPNAENHSASSYLDASLGTSDQSAINKTNMKKYDETEALNNEAVDAYFFQQSPATIKGRCESLIQQEHIDDDCIIIDDIHIYARENNGIHIDIDANITDCVNNLSDKVCYNLDNGKDFLGEEQQEIYIKGVAKNNHYRSSDRNTPKSNKYNTKSPTNNERQLICKKHRLYSPKDDDNENQYSLRSRKERRPSCSTESPIATCYKELENARKSCVRLPRKRASMQPIISPKTKEINDMFDKIKDNVVNNEKITLVDKKSEQELYFYNMSSESDDEAFKKKKIKVQKRVSSSSLKSTSKHRRSMKPVNYTPYYSSEDECDRVLEPKAVKHTKRRHFNAKKIRKILADEIIRTQQPEVLETSFVQEKCDTHIPDEPEPALLMPVLEEVEPDDSIDQPIISDDKSLKQKKTKKSLKEKCEKLTKPTITSKSKEIVINVAIERENATVSPLPGLVIETEPPKDDLTPLDANVQTMNLSDVLSEKSIATCGDSPITGHNNSNEFPPNLDAMCETFQHRDVGIEEKGRFLAEFLVNLRNQTINSKAAAINTSPMLDMIEKGFVTKSNPKPMSLLNLSPESGSDKSIPNVLLETLSSDDVDSLLNLDAADITRVKRPKTRPVKSVRSELITDSDKSRQELGNIEKGINSQETAIKSSKQAADENPSGISRSVACVESWIRNAAAESSKTGTATETNATDMYEIVMETLDTQLVSINESHGDALQGFVLDNLEELSSLMNESNQKEVNALIRSQQERACALISADAQKKLNMVLLLKEILKQCYK